MEQFSKKGYTIKEAVFDTKEITAIQKLLATGQLKGAFGIRQIIQKAPGLKPILFSHKLKQLLQKLSPKPLRLIKSIYFNKPPAANWVVNWHQDHTLNLKEKVEQEGYSHWRELADRTVVQPPLEVLESILTLRIHLDPCTKENGALRVIPGSHRKGIIDLKNLNREEITETAHLCDVESGGILIMQPLLLHASRRTENKQNRRVLHLEFSSFSLPEGMDWLENYALFS